MMSDLSAFTGYLAAHRPEVDDALARSHAAPMAADPYGVSAAGQIERYLTAPLAAYSANGGKRTRPLICLLACEAVGGRREGALSRPAPSRTSRRLPSYTTTSPTRGSCAVGGPASI
ncbi:MAG: polyprenyl synthetase family protein [Atopobiaceae bacterium]|nr:polyprenyl synthetase family protein [Atopobiaceae bacterium]